MTKTDSLKIMDCELSQTFENNAIVLEASKGTARNGKDYLTVLIGDKSGTIKTMVWNSDESHDELFKAGAILNIKGQVTEYNGQRQLTLYHAIPTHGENPEDYMISAVLPGKITYDIIMSHVQQFKSTNLRTITSRILEQHHEKLLTHPAAVSVHHNYVGGLLYHTYSMMLLGKQIASNYSVVNIDTDLLLAGIILHDIGKVTEYTSHIATEQTLKGKLIGHISIMQNEIAAFAESLNLEDDEQIILLQHLVLSHHGLASNGWGSPVSPLTIEAHILHMVDKLDAEIDAYQQQAVNTKGGEYTDKIFGLNNRKFYMPSYKTQN